MAKKPSKQDTSMASIEKRLDGITGTKNSTLNMQLINQTAASLWIPEGTASEERTKRIVGAIALLKGIRPVDEIEGVLATQMVATHSAAMECLRRAMIPEQSFEGRDQNLKHASKLLSIYARQMEALDKHRGKGQQKVTVEHVHVEAGAQAVVGSVHTGSAHSGAAPANGPALAHNPGKILEPAKPLARTAARRRNHGKNT